MTGYWQANLRDLVQTLGEEDVKAQLQEFFMSIEQRRGILYPGKSNRVFKTRNASTHIVYASYRDRPVMVS